MLLEPNMCLDNLIGISLEKIAPDPDTINRLLHAAERNIMDSKINLVSAENRFGAAYKAIMQKRMQHFKLTGIVL